MIGLPNESEEDVLSIPALCRRIRQETGLLLHVAVSPFVPKPGTIWSGMPFDESVQLKQKYHLLTKAFRKNTIGVLQSISVKEAKLEYALSWADSTISDRLADHIRAGAGLAGILRNTARVDTSFELQRLFGNGAPTEKVMTEKGVST